MAAALLAGCGGGAQEEPSPKPPAATEQAAPAGLDSALDRLSTALRRVGAIADRADCHELPKLKAAVRQAKRRAQSLQTFADDQPAAVAEAQNLTRQATQGVPDLVKSCQEQLELERAADELERQADELDQLGEQP